MTINGKTLSTVQALVTATSTNEGNFRTGVGDVLAQVNANQEALAVVVNCPQVVTTLTSGSSYTVPSNAIAIYIRASGGGGGGGVQTPGQGDNDPQYPSGGTGGDTTISNGALSLSITAKGGTAGQKTFSGITGGSTGGSVQAGKGAEGGQGRTGSGGSNITSYPTMNGKSGSLVSTYIKSSTVGGKVLTYSVGAGGAAATGQFLTAEAGQPGFIELWIW